MPVRTARMAGSSIAAPSAMAWVTDFCNAAYYARDPSERDVDDLRLAWCVLATRWASRSGRRLGARDLPAFNRAFGGERLRAGGRLDRRALLDGARRLLGDWFDEAYHDDRRRAHGIAFETVGARVAFDHTRLLRRGALKDLTPPRRPAEERLWATYDPVLLADPDAALRFLLEPARWPDMASAAGRFTAVAGTELRGATFEISVIAAPAERAPIFTRAYVTCTGVHRDPRALDAEVRLLTAAVPGALPTGADAVALVELTTHKGHFLGRAISHLLIYEHDGATFIRDVGCWDPLPPHLAVVYETVGKDAQVAFWGPEPAEASMLAQLARVTAPR